jgi:PAS domain S-box-containing protein
MEVMANKWLKLPEFNIPPGIGIYIAADGKPLAYRHEGASPLPFQGAATSSSSVPTEPPVGGVLVSQKFEIGNATFTVVFVASARYIAECGSRKPVMALLMGLLVTGLVVGYFWLLTDRMASVERQVTDRWLELRERERYIRHLVDNTSDAIFLRDEQGKILDINKRACDSLGYSREELLSMTVVDVEFPVVTEDQGPAVKHLGEEYPRTFEGIHRRKDGTTFPVEVHLTSVGRTSQPLLLALVRDITDRKQAEMTS